MGRMLGRFDSDDSFDRPDLNKCPECGCFFSQDTCPLCGTPCPDEFRAGNRKKVKRRRRSGSGYTSGRVTFVEWYHCWWFIILMMFVSPLISLILLLTSPYKKSLKITCVSIAAVLFLVSTVGLGTIIHFFTAEDPINTSLSREEYIAECESVTPEAFYRYPGEYDEAFVTLTLKVEKKIIDSDGYYYNNKYTSYYICTAIDNPSITLLVRDCTDDGEKNYISGDLITVYGEGAGSVTVYDMDYNPHSAPCVNSAFIVLNTEA